MAGLRLHRDIDPLCACACNGATDTTFTHPTGFCIQDRGLRIDDQLLYRPTGLQDCEDNFLIRLSVEVVTCESGQPQRCEYRSYLPLKDSCTFSVTIDGYAGPSGDLNADQVLYMTGIPISQAWGGINPFICRYVATCAATITGLPCDVLAVYKTSAWITCSGTNTAPCLSETITRIDGIKHVTPAREYEDKILVDAFGDTTLDYWIGLTPAVHTDLSSITFGDDDDDD